MNLNDHEICQFIQEIVNICVTHILVYNLWKNDQRGTKQQNEQKSPFQNK